MSVKTVEIGSVGKSNGQPSEWGAIRLRHLCAPMLAAVAAALFSSSSFAELKPSGMSLALFQSGRVKESTVFHVKVMVTATSEWVSGMPSSERDNYWALRAYMIDGKDPARTPDYYGGVRCFAKKDSDVGKIVETQLGDGISKEALVGLHYAKHGDVIIVDALELVADANKPAVAENKDKTREAAITAKFGASRIGIVRSDDYDLVNGKIEANVKSTAEYFKRPLCRVVVLTDESGSRVVRDCIMDGVNDTEKDSHEYYYSSETYRAPMRSIMFKHTTTMGDSSNKPFRPYSMYGTRDNPSHSIEELSASQAEVARAECKKLVFEGINLGKKRHKSVKGATFSDITGYSLIDRKTKYKMLGYRIEIWQDGVCATAYDSIKPAQAKRLNLPEDWHVSFKYPQKFLYRAPAPVNADR